MKKKILFIAAIHGNERLGVEVTEQLKTTQQKNGLNVMIGNPKALRKNQRFIDADLNRVFPGKKNGNYEEQRAQKIIEKSKSFDWVVDLHGSASATGIFIIITKFTLANLFLALRFNIKKIVIWPGVPETIGSLSSYMPAGIEIESGYRDDPVVKKELRNKLKKFLIEADVSVDFEKRLEEKQIFWYSGKLEKKNNKKPHGLENWKKLDDYYPLFVDGQYSDLWCYKFKRIKLLKFILEENSSK